MTKLENRLAIEIFGVKAIGTVLTDEQVKKLNAVTGVCKTFIELGFDAGKERGRQEAYCEQMDANPDFPGAPKNKENWLKSEGITE